MDVYSVEDFVLYPQDRKLVSTGLSFEIPKGLEIQVRSKSGLAVNNGIMCLNSPGTLDSGYRGELKVILFNTGREPFIIKKGQKIAQIILSRYEYAEIQETKELSETSRGSGGFGSTGLNRYSN
jgi:dUTP pyrophosphatase